MLIAVCQTNPIIGDIDGNKKEILQLYQKATDRGADLAVFPELSLLGYPPLDLVEKREFRDYVVRASLEIAEATNNSTAIIFGSLHQDDDNIGTNIFNSAWFCHSKKVQLIQHKTLIPNYDVFDEMRYFESAKETYVIEFKGRKLGISICEDIWNDKDYWKIRLYPEDPIEKLIKKGADLLINISASPYSFGKRNEKHIMLSEIAKKYRTELVYTSCAGAQTDLIFDGASMCYNKNGQLIKLGAFYKEDFFIVDTESKAQQPHQIEREFAAEIHDALIWGISDYCRKLNFKKAIIGLSGGIDSALVTYLAVKALGAENVLAVLMPSKFSSRGSIEDSVKLAEKLKINYKTISIEPVFNTVTGVLEPVFEGKEPDVTEENLQSRIRGLYLMALSNKFGYLLLTTGNKSEIATGYATLYGDMCGALAVIGDVYKTDVYRLCNYINRDEEIIPVEIIRKEPSAELRHNQKDSDSLPVYDTLDKILRMYLEENKEWQEIGELMGDSQLVRGVLTMVDKNEFKRKQAAPVLRVSYKAFGYGRRYPIVQKWSR